MALFSDNRDVTRLERRVDKMEDAQQRHFDKIEALLAEIRDEMKKHAERANGHPARVIWHGMTWHQIIGIGLLIIIGVMVGVDTRIDIGEVGQLREILEAITANSTGG